MSDIDLDEVVVSLERLAKIARGAGLTREDLVELGFFGPLLDLHAACTPEAILALITALRQARAASRSARAEGAAEALEQLAELVTGLPERWSRAEVVGLLRVQAAALRGGGQETMSDLLERASAAEEEAHMLNETCKRLRTENERLRAQIVDITNSRALAAAVIRANTDRDRALRENERLRAALEEIDGCDYHYSRSCVAIARRALGEEQDHG